MKTLKYYLLAIIIGSVMIESCSPAWYKQMKDKVKLELTYDNGDIGYMLVPDKYYFSCGCIITEEKTYVCGVRVFKELN